jgi:hypothetical protein
LDLGRELVEIREVAAGSRVLAVVAGARPSIVWLIRDVANIAEH